MALARAVLVKVSTSFPSIHPSCAGCSFDGVRAEEGSLAIGCRNSGCSERIRQGRGGKMVRVRDAEGDG